MSVTPISASGQVVSPTTTNKKESDDEDSLSPEFQDTETISLFGKSIDKESAIIFSLAIAAWCGLWYYTGLSNMTSRAKILYIIFGGLIIFFILSIFTSDVRTADYVTEELRLSSVEQSLSIISAMLFAMVIFSSNLLGGTSADEKMKQDTLEVLLIALIPSLLGLFYVSVPKEGNKVRILRKVKQSLQNVSIGLIITAISYALFNIYKKD